MAVSALLPIAGVAVVSLAREAVSAAGSGLSFAAELVRQGRTAANEPQASDSGITAARQQFAAALTQFARRLQQHLKSAGLAVAGPIELAADGLRGIEVGSNHPQQAAIEQLLAGDDSLREQFAALAEGYEQFIEGSSRHDFGLLIDGDEAEVIPKMP